VFMKKLHLSLTGLCNERCLFCTKAGQGGQGELSAAQSLRVIYAKRAEGCDTLIFDGGEPTLRPDLGALVCAAIKMGYRTIAVVTNGVALADKSVTGRLSACHPAATRKLDFCVSLHSHHGDISERLTGSQATFERTLAGLDNILEAGFSKVSVYHVITELNYRELPQFADFVIRRFPKVREVTFSYIFPSGAALEHMEIYPRLSKVTPYFSAAVKKLKRARVRVDLSACGMVPLCLLGGNEDLAVTQYLGDNSANSEIYDATKAEPFILSSAEFSHTHKVKSRRCRACVLNEICGGIWKIYAALHGVSELRPLKLAPASGLRKRAPVKISAGMRAGADFIAFQEVCIRVYAARMHGYSRIIFTGNHWRDRADMPKLMEFINKLGLKFGPRKRKIRAIPGNSSAA